MIEEIVTVTAAGPEGVRVAAERNSACAQCSSRSNCSQGVLSQWRKDKMVEVAVMNPEGLSVPVGAQVVIGLQEGSLMKASFLLYCIPLLCLILAAIAASALGWNEPAQVVAALGAMLAGFWAVRRYANSKSVKSDYQPVLLKILET